MNGSYERICVDFEQKTKQTKQNNIGFPTFKLPPSTKNFL